MSSSLPQERRLVLVAELKKLKDRVNDAGVAKASTAKPSGAGMKGTGARSVKPLMNITDDEKGIFKYYYKILYPKATDDTIDKIIEKGMTRKQFMNNMERGARRERDSNALTRTASRLGEYASNQAFQLENKLTSRGTGIGSSKAKKGKGVSSSKIAPLPSAMIQGMAEPVNEVIGRIGAPYDEPVAMAVGETPTASSAFVSPKREKKIRAEIKKKRKKITGLRNEINRNQMLFGYGLIQAWVDETEGLIQRLAYEIDLLNDELTGRETLMADVEGRGMKKKKKN
jgi:hypothetical protein